jgi:hypothetical protein
MIWRVSSAVKRFVFVDLSNLGRFAFRDHFRRRQQGQSDTAHRSDSCQSCVDAPVDASGFLRFEHVIRCCRVSGLMMRLFTRRGPVWRSADRVQIGVARSRRSD